MTSNTTCHRDKEDDKEDAEDNIGVVVVDFSKLGSPGMLAEVDAVVVKTLRLESVDCS